MRRCFEKIDVSGDGATIHRSAPQLRCKVQKEYDRRNLVAKRHAHLSLVVGAFLEMLHVSRVIMTGTLDHEEIKRLAYMLGMDLKIEDIDKSGDGEVDFGEFQKWWSGNKTRAQVMSRVAMQMDRDKANAVEAEPGRPAAVYIGGAGLFTAMCVLPTVYSVLAQIGDLKAQAELDGYNTA